MPAPEIRDDAVTWRIPYDVAPGGVRLDVDWVLAGDLEFARADDVWTYRLPRPAASRLEYRLILRHPAGHGDPGLDPTNSRRIANPFGDRSVIEFSDYEPPAWLGTPTAGEPVRLEVGVGRLGAAVPARLWSPAGLGPEVPAPVLVANDGTGLAADGGLLSWASWHGREFRPLRVLLLDPADGRRDDWYSADGDYSDDVATLVLPAVREAAAVSATVGLGISLGALATLALQRRHPDAYDAVVLQSGSFFTPRTDPQESGYARFERVCAAVSRMKLEPPERVVPAFVACGAIEENLPNNLELVDALRGQGYPVDWRIFPDAHTMTGWRDSWAPSLDRLLDLL